MRIRSEQRLRDTDTEGDNREARKVQWVEGCESATTVSLDDTTAPVPSTVLLYRICPSAAKLH